MARDTQPLLACAAGGGIVLAIAVTRADAAKTRRVRIGLDPSRRDLARWRCSPPHAAGTRASTSSPRPLQGLFDGLQNAASLRVGFRTTPTYELSTVVSSTTLAFQVGKDIRDII